MISAIIDFMKEPHLKFEKEIWNQKKISCGIDEVGRGCLAGPVVAAAVVISADHKPIKNIRDSKKLTPKMRRELFEIILENCLDFGIGLASAKEIDEIGIAPASKKAMARAVNHLSSSPDHLLIDAFRIEEIEITQTPIIKGDEICYSIACASIVAKVFRDNIVSGLDNIYPKYSFSTHKGYGAKMHIEAIKKHGLTDEHRRSFNLCNE